MSNVTDKINLSNLAVVRQCLTHAEKLLEKVAARNVDTTDELQALQNVLMAIEDLGIDICEEGNLSEADVMHAERERVIHISTRQHLHTTVGLFPTNR